MQVNSRRVFPDRPESPTLSGCVKALNAGRIPWRAATLSLSTGTTCAIIYLSLLHPDWPRELPDDARPTDCPAVRW